MRSLLLLAVLARHAHADDQIMYEITVTDTTVQDLADGKPTGKPRPAPMTYGETSSCHFDKAPSGPYHPWLDGTIDDAGRFQRAHHDGGAAEEVVFCARGVVINASFKVPPGSYRLSGKATFKKVRVRI